MTGDDGFKADIGGLTAATSVFAAAVMAFIMCGPKAILLLLPVAVFLWGMDMLVNS